MSSRPGTSESRQSACRETMWKRVIASCGLVAALAAGRSEGATLVHYDPVGPRADFNAVEPASVLDGVTVSDLSQSKPDGYVNSDRWPNWIVQGPLDETDYVTFTVTPQSGHWVTLDELRWDGFLYREMAVTVTARTSADGFSSDVASHTRTGPGARMAFLNFGGLSPSFGPVEVRLYFHGATDPGEWYDLVSSVDEQSGLTLAGSTGDPANIRARTFTSFSGSAGGSGAVDATGSAARFHNLRGAALDAGGNLYVTESWHCTVRKISPSGEVTTFAGVAGECSFADGPVETARFGAVTDAAVDGAGNVYVIDESNRRIRKITQGGIVSTVAGNGIRGVSEGDALAATINLPGGITAAADGTLYLAEYLDCVIRKISGGMITTLAGSVGQCTHTDANGASARFGGPVDLAVDGSNNLLVADFDSRTVRKVAPDGTVTTLAGEAGQSGNADGSGTAARFSSLTAIAAHTSGDLFALDANTIRAITKSGAVTTAAGPWPVIHFRLSYGIAVDPDRNVYFTDGSMDTLLRLSAGGIVSTPAGSPLLQGGDDGAAADARYVEPGALARDQYGHLYVLDHSANTLRMVEPDGFVHTRAGAFLQAGTADGPGTEARFREPRGMAFDSSWNLYIADTENHTIRKFAVDGTVTTFAGAAGEYGLVNGPVADARFRRPVGLVFDAGGNLLVADSRNRVIRRISTDGVVTTLAGSGNAGSSDGTGSEASFVEPRGLAINPAGDLFVADFSGSVIRRVTPAGVVTTVAGTPLSYGHQDGYGSDARFNRPIALAFDPGGSLYVADWRNHAVRIIAPDGRVTTFAGEPPVAGSEAGTGQAARFEFPAGLAIFPNGEFFVAVLGGIRVGRLALDAAATIDQPVAKPGVTRILGVDGDIDGPWQWALVRRPSRSSAALSSEVIRNPTFTPDVPGFYRFQLTMTANGLTSITTTDLLVSRGRSRTVRH